MKSIKPGRGPSMMSGVVGVFMIGIGVAWTAIAAQMSAIFALFGVLWTCIAVAMTVYNFKNATSKHRYSAFDITEDGEETDPLNERFGDRSTDNATNVKSKNRFCPFCGSEVKSEYKFCGSCGKKLP